CPETLSKEITMSLVNNTPELLSELKLHGIREALPKRLQELHSQQWSSSEFLNICLQDEQLHRQNVRLLRRLREASFPITASLENLDFTSERKLSRSQIRELGSASFVTQGRNILIAGPTGVGKTHLACALGQAACRQGFTSLFFPLNRLLEKMALLRAQGRYLNLLKKLTTVSVVVIDDFG
ncbi:IstB ATP binding domain-containing protein, partial [mine drainage metagenome]